MKRFFAVISAFILALSVLSACGEQPAESAPESTTVYAEITETSVENTVETTEGVSEEVTEGVSETVSETVSQTVLEEITENSAPATVEEIVDYFNESANKIKPTAKKVVKNYEKRIVNKDKLVFPESLASVASGLIDKFMKDDTEPIVYETREEITNEFLVPNQSYVSKLRPEWVKSAECTDNGKQYIITIKLKDEKNSVSGSGVGSVCDVIEAHEVADKAPFVEKFETEYYNCGVIATVDKASGNVVHMKYTVSVLLDITVDLFGTHDVAAGLTFEKDYTITY